MRSLPQSAALSILSERVLQGLNVDGHYRDKVKQAKALFLLTLDEAAFFSLIWVARDDSRLLTPTGQPRSVRCVAERFLAERWTFRTISAPQDRPPTEHNPRWFSKCVPIDEGFTREKFGWIGLSPANDSERRQTPFGSFYIEDGAHKSLVLAKRILAGEIEYRAVEALLILPRF